MPGTPFLLCTLQKGDLDPDGDLGAFFGRARSQRLDRARTSAACLAHGTIAVSIHARNNGAQQEHLGEVVKARQKHNESPGSLQR